MVPELPASSVTDGRARPPRPRPWMVTSRRSFSPSEASWGPSTTTPSAAMHASVAAQSDPGARHRGFVDRDLIFGHKIKLIVLDKNVDSNAVRLRTALDQLHVANQDILRVDYLCVCRRRNNGKPNYKAQDICLSL